MARVERPMKPDFFPVFPMHLLMDEDYEHLDRGEWGSVFLLMQHQWIKEGTLPDDPAKLAQMARCTREELEDLMERWPKLQPVEDQPGRVAIPWLLQEYRRAIESWRDFREKQAEKGRKSAAARAAAAGTVQPPADGGAPVAKPEVNHGSTTVQPPSHPIPSHPIKEGSNDPSTPAPRKRAAARPKPGTLQEILGGGEGTPTWEAYWKLVGTFGGQAKNPAPKTTAMLYAQALAAGTSPEQIQAQADALRRSASEARFMPQLQKWLEGQGYLTPDLKIPTPTPTNGANHAPRTPSHRAEVDAAYLAQLDQRPARPLESAGDDPELRHLWADPAHP